MIIYQCDICKKRKYRFHELEHMVLYKTKIDYCKECEEKVQEIKQKLKKSIQYYNLEADKQIAAAEINILKQYG